MVDETDDTPEAIDRAAILARRSRFIAAAITGLASSTLATACPCLEVVGPQPDTDTDTDTEDGGSTTADGTGTASSGAATGSTGTDGSSSGSATGSSSGG